MKRSWKLEDLTDGEKVRSSLVRRSEDRLALLQNYIGPGNKPTFDDVLSMRRFLNALALTVGTRRRTVLKGLGVFEWHPWRGRTPTVTDRKSWRLTFQLTYSKRKYRGG